eukprot:scaffold75888_cov29-Tisochrysis_lutea.AAC.1
MRLGREFRPSIGTFGPLRLILVAVVLPAHSLGIDFACPQANKGRCRCTPRGRRGGMADVSAVSLALASSAHATQRRGRRGLRRPTKRATLALHALAPARCLQHGT